MTNGGILCFSEDPGLIGGLIARAATLRTGPDSWVGVATLGSDAVDAAGAHRVYRVTSPNLRLDSPENVALALAGVITEAKPQLVLFGSTKRGREYAARLAGLVDGALVAGASEVSVAPEGIRIRREMLSGNAVGEELIIGRLPIVAVMPETTGTPMASAQPPETVDVHLDLSPPPTTVVERKEKPSGSLRIEAADRIVAVGRGLQKRDDLTLIEQLARGLGAVVGCTRPIAAEAGWLGDDHWIGLTGHRVKPRLYVAIGISGAVQHLVGMRDSQVVVAINKDPNAPIFAHADYRLTGDLYAVVPALLKLLETK